MMLEHVQTRFILTINGERIEFKHPWTQRAMKPRDIFKDIFGLAVRLLGLVFLYFGLSAVPSLLDFGAIETAGKSDVVSAILPIAFNLAVSWWLIGGGLLTRRAYPEKSRILDASPSPAERVEPTTPQALPDMETAEKKLASLVAKK